MKKFILILILVILAMGGVVLKHNLEEKSKEEELVQEAKVEMSRIIKENYMKIESINFNENYSINPIGTIDIEGYLNGDKSQKFFGSFKTDSKEIISFVVDAEEKK
ncbi:DUF1433 domain-containing protein [Bacillus sp. NPDC077027]|uniref:DUF1433 domain-containing protein n=1 Tax=Bacillus sp. NPDC077027 TaxID=3390548 RepID=UPI003CFE6D45